jgi:hypothetical protein
VQHQSELVQHQRHADTEQRRRGSRPAGPGVLNRQAADTTDAHEYEPENDMMVVDTARRHVSRPPLHLGADHPDAEPDEKKRRDESNEETEKPQPAAGHD